MSQRSNGLDSCTTDRRRNLINEFQGLLECIDRKPSGQCGNMDFDRTQPQLVCMPMCSSQENSQGDGDDGRTRKQIDKERMNKELEKLPTITGCSVEERRPIGDMRMVDGENSAHVKFMDIEDFTEWKKNRLSQQSGVPRMCFLPCQNMDPCCPPGAPQFYCLEPEEVPKKRKIPEALPWDQKELLGGILYSTCDCNKRNGLQHDCPRTECQGRPPCLVKPIPDCIPSGGTGRMRPVPRVSNYPKIPEYCNPCPPREKHDPMLDTAHRAEMECEKCKPILMCRPVCETNGNGNGGQTSRRGCCPIPCRAPRPTRKCSRSSSRSMSSQQCPQQCPPMGPVYLLPSCPDQISQYSGQRQARRSESQEESGLRCFSNLCQ